MSALDKITNIPVQGQLPDDFLPTAYLVAGDFAAHGSILVEPASVDEGTKTAVRALLRWGGYKPSGRGRPASESLAKALADGRWPVIHPLVDECNRLSLNSGLPISVVDAGLLSAPLSFRIGQPGEEYAFNPSGQILDVKGLLLLADLQGPTGSPVKDAQRSKVSPETQEFLIVIWGTRAALAAGSVVRQGLEDWCAQRQATCRQVVVGL